MTWGPIVAGVDASPAGAGAAAAAWQWAQAAGTPCQLVHAAREIWLGAGGVPGVVDAGPLMAEVVRLSRQDVERTLAGQVPSDLIATMMVRSGPAAQVLRDVAAERGADLVVLGAKRHGLVARWLGGSTAKNVTRALETSVLVSTGPRPVGRVLVALDVSDAALPTLATAERVARLFGAKLRVLHAIEPFPYAAEGITVVDVTVLAEQAEAAFETTIWPKVTYPAAEKVIRHGPAVSVIEHEAMEWPADLVVVGAHGRSRAERIFLGSVSEGVVNALPSSVLVVRGLGPGAGTK